jgi:hypothetical protein
MEAVKALSKEPVSIDPQNGVTVFAKEPLQSV